MSEAVSVPEHEYEAAADRTLQAMQDRLTDIAEGFESDLSSGILTIEFEDGTKYVINSHRAARQIWMAAERSAWHFDLQPAEGRWVAGKSGDELWTTVEGVLSRKLGRKIELPR
ncbi:MAG TPA: iron donor protein CyaY [Candidatus Nanopelagicales bacterium]|nr:iron donor protein CyaY [Candidatus Nanopelagicales bacterium]